MSVTSKIERRDRSLRETDSMSPGLRACVHEYGYPIVNACLTVGIRRPETIHMLVREIWEGARQAAQRRVKGGTVDWILSQAGCDMNAPTLVRILHNNNLAIVPLFPTKAMLEASASAVCIADGPMTKTEKHRRRLLKALAAGARHFGGTANPLRKAEAG